MGCRFLPPWVTRIPAVFRRRNTLQANFNIAEQNSVAILDRGDAGNHCRRLRSRTTGEHHCCEDEKFHCLHGFTCDEHARLSVLGQFAKFFTI